MLVPNKFRVLRIEPYNGTSDPTNRVSALQLQMALFAMIDAILCRIFSLHLWDDA